MTELNRKFQKNQVLAIDIGGTNIRGARMTLAGSIVKKTSEKIVESRNLADFVAQVNRIIDELADESAYEIGMILPIPWTKNHKVIDGADNLSFLNGLTISEFKNFFKPHKVFIENDVNAIALYESQQLKQRAEVVVYMTISTGIAVGIVINDNILHGKNGYVGEIGYTLVEEQTTFENLFSGKALEDISLKLLGSKDVSAFFRAYENNHEPVTSYLNHWLENVSTVIYNLTVLLDPDQLVMGGAVITENEWLVEQLHAKVNGKLSVNDLPALKMTLSTGLADSGLYGASSILIKK